ncbi:MAG: hypothetical protein ACSHXB_00745 [Sulfitobacter sp.]
MIMRCLAFVAILACPLMAVADAGNPWPAVDRFLALNGCRISEAQLVDVLRAEGVDTWAINIMVTNYAKRDTVTFENQTGLHRVRNTGICN